MNEQRLTEIDDLLTRNLGEHGCYPEVRELIEAALPGIYLQQMATLAVKLLRTYRDDAAMKGANCLERAIQNAENPQ